jgi:hypothetical protein
LVHENEVPSIHQSGFIGLADPFSDEPVLTGISERTIVFRDAIIERFDKHGTEKPILGLSLRPSRGLGQSYGKTRREGSARVIYTRWEEAYTRFYPEQTKQGLLGKGAE